MLHQWQRPPRRSPPLTKHPSRIQFAPLAIDCEHRYHHGTLYCKQHRLSYDGLRVTGLAFHVMTFTSASACSWEAPFTSTELGLQYGEAAAFVISNPLTHLPSESIGLCRGAHSLRECLRAIQRMEWAWHTCWHHTIHPLAPSPSSFSSRWASCIGPEASSIISYMVPFVAFLAPY